MGSVFCGGDPGDSECHQPDRRQSVQIAVKKAMEKTARKTSYLSIEQDADSEDEKERECKEWTVKKLSVLPGQCLIEQTFDLSQDLEALRARFPKYQDLVDRQLLSAGSEHQSPSITTPGPTIKVMQFNMLADGLSTAYRWTKTEKSFIGVDQECLQWTYRGLRIVEEMLRFEPDLIAIEECDRIDFLSRWLSPRGYDHCFQPKTSSPIRHVIKAMAAERGMEPDALSMPPDGVAIFFKTQRFRLSDSAKIQRIAMDENKQKVTALGVTLEMRVDDGSESTKWSEWEEVLFVVTHLKSTKSAEGERVRRQQIRALLGDQDGGPPLISNPDRLPVVLCCDLNANPVPNQKGYDPLCYEAITNQMGYRSTYRVAMGTEPEMTTFKRREHGVDRHCIDYIFVDDERWSVSHFLQIPDSENGLIPNWNYPSDHFSILVAMTLSRKGSNEQSEEQEDDR